MEFPPHVPLPVPERLPPLPEVPNLGRKGLGLMTAEEQESNQQLYHAVRLLLRVLISGRKSSLGSRFGQMSSSCRYG